MWLYVASLKVASRRCWCDDDKHNLLDDMSELHDVDDVALMADYSWCTSP